MFLAIILNKCSVWNANDHHTVNTSDFCISICPEKKNFSQKINTTYILLNFSFFIIFFSLFLNWIWFSAFSKIKYDEINVAAILLTNLQMIACAWHIQNRGFLRGMRSNDEISTKRLQFFDIYVILSFVFIRK